ncbi:MAG: hypothetical protein HY751_04670 [Nitrospinae bacterium]|nr:hypothetical protein [Nitrospinota bacterium]
MNISKPVVLIGFKASGKSTIGRMLAARLNLEYTDTDAIIEGLYTIFEGEQLNCREIYKKRGGDYFRKLELEAVKESLKNNQYSVVSFGGGSLVNAESAGVDFSGAVFVYLKVEKEELFQRIMRDGVPAFFDPANPSASFEKQFAERAPVYERHAHITVENTSCPVEEAVENVITELGKIRTALGAGVQLEPGE